ncbi:MAG: propionyl-coenzyme A carboxylase alpha polypeptide, partial [Mesorhizobium sp.]
MRSVAPPSVLPDISPTRGEIGCHPGFRQSPMLKDERRLRSCQSPP